MAYTHIGHVDLDIGGGMSATEAWVNSSPIALVAAHSRGGSTVKSRLDMQKRVFIDDLPATPNLDAIERLIVRLMGARRAAL